MEKQREIERSSQLVFFRLADEPESWAAASDHKILL